MRLSEQEADIRPVTPSKIPVGAFRVEEEKAINRALGAGPEQVCPERSTSPAAPSRIPKFAIGLGVNFKRVQVRLCHSYGCNKIKGISGENQKGRR